MRHTREVNAGREGSEGDAARLLAALREVHADVGGWLGGGPRHLPSARRDWGQIEEPALRARSSPERHRRGLVTAFRMLANELFAIRMPAAAWDPLVDDPAIVALFWDTRRRLYEHVRAQGRLRLACPRCAAPRDVSLAEVATALGRDLPPIAEPDGTPALPTLARFRGPRLRPAGIPTIAVVRALLPSRRANVRASFAVADLGPPVSAAQAAAAMRADAWAGAPNDPASPHSTFRRDANPAFAALVNLRTVCLALDGRAPVTIDDVEALPVADAAFLDAAYDLLCGHDLPTSPPGIVTCPGCGLPYLLAH